MGVLFIAYELIEITLVVDETDLRHYLHILAHVMSVYNRLRVIMEISFMGGCLQETV